MCVFVCAPVPLCVHVCAYVFLRVSPCVYVCVCLCDRKALGKISGPKPTAGGLSLPALVLARRRFLARHATRVSATRAARQRPSPRLRRAQGSVWCVCVCVCVYAPREGRRWSSSELLRSCCVAVVACGVVVCGGVWWCVMCGGVPCVQVCASVWG